MVVGCRQGGIGVLFRYQASSLACLWASHLSQISLTRTLPDRLGVRPARISSYWFRDAVPWGGVGNLVEVVVLVLVDFAPKAGCFVNR